MWAFADTLNGEGGASANFAAHFSPTTYNTTQSKNDGDLQKFLSIPPLHGIIPTFFENAKNGRKKTGNLFLISCLGVPFYVAAVIQFWGMAVHQNET